MFIKESINESQQDEDKIHVESFNIKEMQLSSNQEKTLQRQKGDDLGLQQFQRQNSPPEIQ